MMNSSEAVPTKMVKVYLRNQQKIAKIVLFPQSVPANQLYSTASISYNIAVQNIQLFYGGKFVEKDSMVALSDNSILHVVNLQHLEAKELVLIVKQIEGNAKQVTFRSNSNTKVKDFIDEKLATVFGLKSDGIFLVHMGRQLALQKTFKEQLVQTNCQLLCLKFQQQPKVPTQTNKNGVINDENYVVNVSVKQSDLMFEGSQKLTKDIYPAPNFTIQVPTVMEVQSTNNHLNLIFDSKMRRSSSIRGIDFTPDQIIAEEDDLSFIEQHSYRSQSEHKAHEKSNISHYSEHANDTSNDNKFAKEINNGKRSRLDEKKSRAQIGDMIKIQEFKEDELGRLKKDLQKKFSAQESAKEIRYQD